MKENRYEIVLAGSGGQGIILASVILAEAVGEYEGKFVAQSQSYGPEARGGSSRADVVISEEPIDYPLATKPDVLLAMNQQALNSYKDLVKEEGLIIVDSSNVSHVPEGRVIKVPITDIAIKKVGKAMVANIVALGVLAQVTKVVSPKNLKTALLARVPKGTEELNSNALELGLKAAKKFKPGSLPIPKKEEPMDDL